MLCVAAAAMVGVGTGENVAVTVHTAVLSAATVEETVTCNGIVEAGEVQGVSLPLSCVLEKVMVEAGQAVKAGDVLARVDKEATKALQQNEDRIGEALALSTIPLTVCAPADGVVISVETAAGEVVRKDMPCVTMARQDGLQVRVSIREKHLPQLAVGQRVRVSGAGFDKEHYVGSLSEIAATASAGTNNGERAVEGVVTLDAGQADASMRLGLSAKAKVVVQTAQSGVLIPYEAVLQAEDGVRYIYILRNKTAHREALEVHSEQADGLLVQASHWDGVRVILQPETVPYDGAAVLEASI